MPRKLTKNEIDEIAKRKLLTLMCQVGIVGARKIFYAAWKLAQVEEKRQKEAGNYSRRKRKGKK